MLLLHLALLLVFCASMTSGGPDQPSPVRNQVSREGVSIAAGLSVYKSQCKADGQVEIAETSVTW